MELLDESEITEITIGPDGRIFVFGLSAQVLDTLAALVPAGHAWRTRAEHLRALCDRRAIRDDAQRVTAAVKPTDEQR